VRSDPATTIELCAPCIRQPTPIDIMSKKRPVQLKVWMECPSCGHLDKLTREFELPVNEATPRVEKVAGPCERCARPAYMVFQRTVPRIH
jgi:hypothetical protein